MSGVLVTGAGGAAGVAVIAALVTAGERVVGGDPDPEAVGLRVAGGGVALLRADDPGFGARLVTAAACARVDVVISTVSEELVAVHDARPALLAAGIRVWVPPPVAVRTCVDKWAFTGACTRLDVAAPATGLGSEAGVPGPWIVKPRCGRGSRDVERCDTEDEVRVALGRVPDPIVQTRLAGREFTVDALRAPGAEVAVPRWRLQTRGGISTRGRTFADDRVSALALRLLAGIGVDGVANVQGFVTDDDEVVLTEVNPRFSGGLPLTLAAGADTVGEYLRVIRGLPARAERLRWRSGVLMMRRFTEVFEG